MRRLAKRQSLRLTASMAQEGLYWLGGYNTMSFVLNSTTAPALVFVCGRSCFVSCDVTNQTQLESTSWTAIADTTQRCPAANVLPDSVVPASLQCCIGCRCF